MRWKSSNKRSICPHLKKIHGILGPGKSLGLAVLHVSVMKGGDIDVCLGVDRDL